MAELGRARPVVLAAIATILTANIAILSSNRATVERTDGAASFTSTTSTTTHSTGVVLFGKADSPMAIPTVFRVLPDGSSLTASARPPVRTDQRIGNWKFFANADGIAASHFDGTAAAQVTVGGHDSDPRLDPTGHTVAYLHRMSTTVNAVGFTTPTGVPLGLLVPPLGSSYQSFAWSPQGTEVALVRTTGPGPTAVFIASLIGEAPRQIAQGDYRDIDWSHHGDRLAAVRANDVWLMALDGSAAVRVTRLAGTRFVTQPMWSPDDSQIAFVSTAARPAIDVVHADGTHLTTAYQPSAPNCVNCEYLSLFGWAPRGNMAV